MRMNYRICFLLLISFWTNNYVFAEDKGLQHYLDSVTNIIQSEVAHDTLKARAYADISGALYTANHDTMVPLCERSIEIVKENLKNTSLSEEEVISFKKSWSIALNNIGYIQMSEGNDSLALDYYQQSLQLKIEVKDRKGESAVLNNIGYLYNSQGKVAKALEYYLTSLKIKEEINDQKGLGPAFNNIARIYEQQGDTLLGLSYYEKSLEIRENNNDKRGLVYTLSNIGNIQRKLGNKEKALEAYQKGYKVAKEINFTQGQSIVLYNLGFIEYEQKNYYKALDWYYETSALRKGIQDKKGLSYTYHGIGQVHFQLGNLDSALVNAKKSYQLAKEISHPSNIMEATSLLGQIYERTGKFEKALEMFQMSVEMKDSLHNTKTEKATLKQQLQYEYEKEKEIKALEHQQEIKLLEEEEKRSAILTISILVVLALTIIFLLIVFRRLKITRKQKAEIEVLNVQLDQQAQALAKSLKEVETSKSALQKVHEELREKNQDLMDSIRYAERIQKALLKTEIYTEVNLPEQLIYFQPKDIVSGDFYWTYLKDDHYYFAVADCTGHGVPGALLTMLGTSLLNEIVLGKELPTPAEVLNALRDGIIRELNQKGEEGESRDGMDISLIRMNLKEQSIQWAGANNPLYILKEEVVEIIPANKQPIAYYGENMHPFTNHSLNVQKGDSLVLFTDGFADQFGGPKNKKFKYKPFRELLHKNCNLPLPQQKLILEQTLLEWKKDVEQVDDICVAVIKT